MPTRFKKWLSVVDAKTGRLLQAKMTPHDRLHIDLVESMDNTHEEHAHVRPSPRTSKNGHSYATFGHEDEEMARRYASDVIGWLTDALARHAIKRLAVLAPPRLLGVLREQCPNSLNGHLQFHQEDLGKLSPSQLAGLLVEHEDHDEDQNAAFSWMRTNIQKDRT